VHSWAIIKQPLTAGLVGEFVAEIRARGQEPSGLVVNEADRGRVAGYLAQLGLGLPLDTARNVLQGELWAVTR